MDIYNSKRLAASDAVDLPVPRGCDSTTTTSPRPRRCCSRTPPTHPGRCSRPRNAAPPAPGARAFTRLEPRPAPPMPIRLSAPPRAPTGGPAAAPASGPTATSTSTRRRRASSSSFRAGVRERVVLARAHVPAMPRGDQTRGAQELRRRRDGDARANIIKR
jgi:hypothetical protein